MVAAYGLRRVYPSVSYTVNGACNLGSLIGNMPHNVVDPACYPGVARFGDDRVDDTGPGGCNKSDGYHMDSVHQAFWELLWGRSCGVVGGTTYCSGMRAPDYADRWMEALLSALRMGNSQHIVQLWDNMEAFIAEAYPSDLALMQHVRQLHEIEALPHAESASCACPQLDGTCG